MTKRGSRPGGRPSKYSRAVAERIIERLADGETLRAICRDKAMPARATVLRWLGAHEEFRDQYARAREMHFDAWADELTEIADDPDGDVGRDRLRIDARKWIMSKALPKKYGDRHEIEHTGGVEITKIERVIVHPEPGPSDG